MTVYLHIVGEGCDGDERHVEAVYATEALGQQAVEEALKHVPARHRDFERRSRHSIEPFDVLEAVAQLP